MRDLQDKTHHGFCVQLWQKVTMDLLAGLGHARHDYYLVGQVWPRTRMETHDLIAVGWQKHWHVRITRLIQESGTLTSWQIVLLAAANPSRLRRNSLWKIPISCDNTTTKYYRHLPICTRIWWQRVSIALKNIGRIATSPTIITWIPPVEVTICLSFEA